VDHATRFGLRFRVHRAEWGAPFDPEALALALDALPAPAWLWVVHGETSTGVLNDLPLLKALTAHRGIRLCLDAVSSLGAAPVDLVGVTYAASVSGKALGALPGLAFVFHAAPFGTAGAALPRYLDLAYYASKDGMPFTVSSNLLYALKAAVEGFDPQRRHARIRDLSARLRAGLCALGYSPLARESMFEAVTTIPLRDTERAGIFGQQLEDAGYLLSYRSEYLLERNWIQACLMGECDAAMVDRLLGVLRRMRERPSVT
jgi:aspartate aminotransferase-like enzyme